MRTYKLMILTLLILILFTTQATASSLFKDISSSDWTYPAVEKLVNDQVIQGYADGTFRPNANVTRAQSAVFIGRALDIDVTNVKNPGYADVTSKTFGYAYIAKLTELGIFAKAERFNPEQTLTRAQMAKIMALSFELKGDATNQFKDVSSSSFAYLYIGQLVKAGITTGTTATTFSPGAFVNRQQLVLFIYRAQNPGQPVTPPVQSDGPTTAEARELLQQVNKARAEAGLPALKYDSSVENVAMIKAKDMRDNNYFAHVSPTYGQPHEMLTQFGIKWTYSGENIAAGQNTVSAVHTAWMNSPGHRANILNQNYTHVGFGYVKGGSYRTYWVQMFIRK